MSLVNALGFLEVLVPGVLIATLNTEKEGPLTFKLYLALQLSHASATHCDVG